MENITEMELKQKLMELGYKIDDGNSFNYTNRLNSVHYKARSCYMVEADTGVSFAHYSKARRDDKFKALQELRRDYVFVVNGRVYEL